MADDSYVVQVAQYACHAHVCVKVSVTDRAHVETFSFHPGEGMIAEAILHKCRAVW